MLRAAVADLTSYLRDLSTRGRRRRQRVFTEIFSTWAWGPGESVSGPGSSRAAAARFLPQLQALVGELGTRVLLDAPCGDFNWAAPLADEVERYVGVDIVAELVAASRAAHASPRRTFLHLDVVRDPLPACDTILCRDCLVHFSFADIRATLANFKRTGARHLITTTFIGDRPSLDIATGAWRPLNLERALGLPPPIATIDEGCQHTDAGGTYSDKRLAAWRCTDL